MNSCLYETQILHHRLQPKEHRLKYGSFLFYLDLDELDEVVKKVPIFGFNKPNIYSFKDSDHFEAGSKPVKEKVVAFLKSQGVDQPERIMLLTYLRSFGYIFNPVSLYFCFGLDQKPLAVVLEIGNTFREIKPFIIKEDKFDGKKYTDRQMKFYYISPFTNLDDSLDFEIHLPAESLNINICTVKDGQKYMIAVMTGKKKELTLKNLLWYTLCFPFVTLQVIILIHWHALWLWLKKVPFHEKISNLDLQKGVYRVWNKGCKIS